MDELIGRPAMLDLFCCEDSSLGGVEVSWVSCLFPYRNDPSSTFPPSFLFMCWCLPRGVQKFAMELWEEEITLYVHRRERKFGLWGRRGWGWGAFVGSSPRGNSGKPAAIESRNNPSQLIPNGVVQFLQNFSRQLCCCFLYAAVALAFARLEQTRPRFFLPHGGLDTELATLRLKVGKEKATSRTGIRTRSISIPIVQCLQHMASPPLVFVVIEIDVLLWVCTGQFVFFSFIFTIQ